MSVEAVILVGGRGTRLAPLTDTCPKPLLPIAGRPFVEHQFERLRAAGITRVVLATSYRSEMFSELYGDGSALGLSLSYVHEAVPLGTGGGIRNAAAGLGPDASEVVVLNGDVLSDHSIPAQVERHRELDADATLHLVAVPDPRAFGTVVSDPAGHVSAFLEKVDDPPVSDINAGCYVFSRAALEAIPDGRVVSVEREVFPQLAEAGRLAAYKEVPQGYWLDIGTVAAYEQANRDLAGVA